MIIALCIAFMFTDDDAFVVSARSEARYSVSLPLEALRGYVDDIGLFARNMPGVVEIQQLGVNTYLYKTRKEVPFGKPVESVFHISKVIHNDSVTEYQSLDGDAKDFMSCTVIVVPAGESETSIEVSLRLRLIRDNASEIHWLAPLLGADFISQKISDDLDAMLQEFIVNSSDELYREFKRDLSDRSDGRGVDSTLHDMEYK